MNLNILKTRLDALYSKLNTPYGVIPAWHEPAATNEEIEETENRLNVILPSELKSIFKLFSGITHDTPYFMCEHFLNLKKKLLELRCIEKDDMDFKDDLIIAQIKSLRNWGMKDDLYDPKSEYANIIDEMGEAFFSDCTKELIFHDKFILIGESYSESVFINLVEGDENYGAIYNLRPYYPNFFAYKIANGYLDFLCQIERSLESQISSSLQG